MLDPKAARPRVSSCGAVTVASPPLTPPHPANHLPGHRARLNCRKPRNWLLGKTDLALCLGSDRVSLLDLAGLAVDGLACAGRASQGIARR